MHSREHRRSVKQHDQKKESQRDFWTDVIKTLSRFICPIWAIALPFTSFPARPRVNGHSLHAEGQTTIAKPIVEEKRENR